ncbi:hypothetical protein V6N11_039422 [Hibiscus sabdariffa]|uniref:RNase H type-1 domain-containing protein n=1 Tax=Hibiscus sabdariffa TaxID=183260 RepID=A0ABR2SNS9_9ROSI
MFLLCLLLRSFKLSENLAKLANNRHIGRTENTVAVGLARIYRGAPVGTMLFQEPHLVVATALSKDLSGLAQYFYCLLERYIKQMEFLISWEYLAVKLALKPICIGYWSECLWPESFVSINEFIRCSKASTIQTSSHKRTVFSRWKPPNRGELKFNVDAVVRGDFGIVGIGGILRDHGGVQIMSFLKSIGLHDPISVEIIAILKAFRVFLESTWCRSHHLIVEPDSLLAIKWIVSQLGIQIKAFIDQCDGKVRFEVPRKQ